MAGFKAQRKKWAGKCVKWCRSCSLRKLRKVYVLQFIHLSLIPQSITRVISLWYTHCFYHHSYLVYQYHIFQWCIICCEHRKVIVLYCYEIHLSFSSISLTIWYRYSTVSYMYYDYPLSTCVDKALLFFNFISFLFFMKMFIFAPNFYRSTCCCMHLTWREERHILKNKLWNLKVVIFFRKELAFSIDF